MITSHPRRRQAGQTLVIFALAAAVIFAVLGLAIDGGADFYVSSQVERAASNAALSAVPIVQGTTATFQSAANQAFAVVADNGLAPANPTIYQDSSGAYPFATEVECNPGFAAACPPSGYTLVSGPGSGSACTATVRSCGTVISVSCVVVTPATSPQTCYNNKLDVGVTTRNANTFASFVGIPATTVTRGAIAEYLPPLSLGQPGGSIGSDATNLGSGGNQYLMRLEAWGSDRTNGDAYTPNPADPGDTGYATTDAHALSGVRGTDVGSPAGLDANGGYSYMIYVPPGTSGFAQIYNPAFAPDAGFQPTGINQNFHEQDSFGKPSLTTASNYPKMTYTLYRVNNVFDHTLDVPLAQSTFDSIIPLHSGAPLADAAGKYGGPCPAATATCVADSWDSVNSAGAFVAHASVMPPMYHGWVDIGKADATDPAGVTSFTAFSGYTGGTALSGGVAGSYYRIRVDAQTYSGADPNSSSTSAAHKGYAGRVVNSTDTTALGAPTCVNGSGISCSFGAINDFAIYTPINGPANPSGFTLSLMQVPPQYAGKIVNLNIFDPGDMSGCPAGPYNTMKVLEPDGSTVPNIIPPSGSLSAGSSDVLDVGPDLHQYLSNPASVTPVQALLPAGYSANQAVFGAINSSGSNLYNGHWLTMQIQIPTNYSSLINVNNPSTWYWGLNYATNCNGNDTITVDLAYGGSPVHLIP